MWRALVFDATGELFSVGTSKASDAALLARGLVAIPLAGPPDLSAVEWDAVTRTFIPVPAPTLTDRAQEILDVPRLNSVLAKLNGPDVDALRDEIGAGFGEKRFYDAATIPLEL